MKPEEGSLAPCRLCRVVTAGTSSFRVSPVVTGVKRRGSFWLRTGCLVRPRSWLAAVRAVCRAQGLASLPCLFSLGAVMGRWDSPAGGRLQGWHR